MGTVSVYFGRLVFDSRERKVSPRADVYRSLRKTIGQSARPDLSVANAAASSWISAARI